MGSSAKIVALAAIALGVYLWYKHNKRQCGSRKSCSSSRRASPARNGNDQLLAPRTALAAEMNRMGSPSKPTQANPPATERTANLLRTEASSSPVNNRIPNGKTKDAPAANGDKATALATSSNAKQGPKKDPAKTSSESPNGVEFADAAMPTVVNPQITDDALPTAVNSQITDAAFPTAVNSQITDAAFPTAVNSQITDAVFPTAVNAQITDAAFPTAVNSQITDAVFPTAVNAQITDAAFPTAVNSQITDAVESASNDIKEPDAAENNADETLVNGPTGTGDKQSSKKKGKKGQK